MTPLRRLERKHWVVLAALLTGLATQLSALEHGWIEAATPRFVGGFILQIATTLSALYVGPPRYGKFTRQTDRMRDDLSPLRRRPADREDEDGLSV